MHAARASSSQTPGGAEDGEFLFMNTILTGRKPNPAWSRTQSTSDAHTHARMGRSMPSGPSGRRSTRIATRNATCRARPQAPRGTSAQPPARASGLTSAAAPPGAVHASLTRWLGAAAERPAAVEPDDRPFPGSSHAAGGSGIGETRSSRGRGASPQPIQMPASRGNRGSPRRSLSGVSPARRGAIRLATWECSVDAPSGRSQLVRSRCAVRVSLARLRPVEPQSAPARRPLAGW